MAAAFVIAACAMALGTCLFLAIMCWRQIWPALVFLSLAAGIAWAVLRFAAAHAP